MTHYPIKACLESLQAAYIALRDQSMEVADGELEACLASVTGIYEWLKKGGSAQEPAALSKQDLRSHDACELLARVMGIYDLSYWQLLACIMGLTCPIRVALEPELKAAIAEMLADVQEKTGAWQ